MSLTNLGGFSEEALKRLRSTKLPDKLKCASCNKYRVHPAYSNTQLNRLRSDVAMKGPMALQAMKIRCRECVGGQNVEMLCTVCHKTKSIDEFAKAQRHRPDIARCLNCVQDHLEADLWEEKDGDDDTESSAADETSQYDEEAFSKSVGEPDIDDDFDIASHGRASTISTFDDDDDLESVGGGVWVESGREDGTSEMGESKTHTFTAFDPQGISHRRMASVGGSSKPAPTGWEFRGVEAAREEQALGRQYSFPKKKSSGRWAKITGSRFPKGTAPSMRIPESAGRFLPAEDDDDDEVNDIESYL